MSHRRGEVIMKSFCFLIFIFEFGVTNSAIYLHFICFSSEKLRYFPIPPHLLFSSVFQVRHEKRKESKKGRTYFSLAL